MFSAHEIMSIMASEVAQQALELAIKLGRMRWVTESLILGETMEDAPSVYWSAFEETVPKAASQIRDILCDSQFVDRDGDKGESLVNQLLMVARSRFSELTFEDIETGKRLLGPALVAIAELSTETPTA